MRKNSGKKKKIWKKIEISKVELNPEQAVLSCCDILIRGETSAGTLQCGLYDGLCGTTGGGGWSGASS